MSEMKKSKVHEMKNSKVSEMNEMKKSKVPDMNEMNKSKVPEEVCQICTVQAARTRWRKTGRGGITVDSVAEESVCPKDWGQEFTTRQPSRWMKFVNASGGSMGHYGEKSATFKVGPNSAVMSLGFQVSDVQKPLVAVRRITEKGNRVQFGPSAEDNFIENMATGSKIMMVRKGGSYVIPAEMVVEETVFRGR